MSQCPRIHWIDVSISFWLSSFLAVVCMYVSTGCLGCYICAFAWIANCESGYWMVRPYPACSTAFRADPSVFAYSPYSRIFHNEASTALSSKTNTFFVCKLDLVSCTNYFTPIHNFRCSVQLIKVAKRDNTIFEKTL